MRKTPAKKKKEERVYGSLWQCHSCADAPEFEQSGAMDHLRDVHGIDTKTTKGTRSMLAHIDGDTWFSWDYEWDIAGLKLTQHTCTKRTGSNAAMWR